MAEEMAGGVLEGAETEIRPETVSTEVAVATPDVMVVDDVNAVGASVAPVEPEVSQPEVVDEKPVPAPPTEEEKLWSAVTSNAGDFQSWTKLISETEQKEDINKLRTVYDKFLEEFPLCYGYWKKYADHEKRNGDYGKPVEVYERAVVAVTYSVDIWMHYAVYKSQDASSTEEEIRSLYERGLQYVGTDWNCYILWDKYIEYELSRSEWGRAAELYSRLLQIPSATLDKSWEKFKECAGAHPLTEIVSALEYEELSKPEPTPVAAGGEEDAPPPADAPIVGKTDAEKLEKYVASREVLYKSSKERVEKVKEFESQIKRPYFHIKALDDVQLNTWHKYLDLIEKEGDLANTVRLYERCVIPGANYPEFWVRYVSSMEQNGDLERAQDALTRATTIFVKRRPEIFLFAAKYREQQGDLEGAKYNFSIAHHLGPCLLEYTIKHANYERRQGNLGAGVTFYEQALQTEKAKEESPSLPFLYLQYARYLDQAARDSEKAREVYKEATEKTPTSKSVWQASMVFEASQPGTDRANRILALAQQAVAAVRPDGTPSLTAGEREELSTMAVELVELYGDAAQSRAADIFHRTHFSPKRGTADTKKRPLPDSTVDRGAKHYKSGGHGYRGGEYSNGQYGGGGYQGSRGPAAGGYGGYAQQPPQGPAAHAGGYGGYNSGYYPPPAPAPAAGYGGYNAAPYAAPQAYAAQPGYGAAPAAAPYYPPQQSYYPQ